MMKFKYFIVLAAIAFSKPTLAQQDEQMSLYLYNKLYFNPAYAGSRDVLSAIGIARFQWVDFQGAPKTQWVSVHAPILQKTLGVGAHLVNDQIGNRSRTSVFGDLSSSIALNKNRSRLAVGISMGVDFIGYDFSSVQVQDQNDLLYGAQLNETRFNIGTGIYYYGDKFYASVSSPRLIEEQPGVFDTLVSTLNSRHYFLSGGYVFTLNSMFKLQPSALVKYTPHAPITADVNVSLLVHDFLSAGILYRFHEAMGVNLVYTIKNTASIGYVYDFPINGLRTYQHGSHELFVRYDFKPKKSVFTSPRYF
jgi:type IX secretion system PorP/SprF family membrane protein